MFKIDKNKLKTCIFRINFVFLDFLPQFSTYVLITLVDTNKQFEKEFTQNNKQ